MILFNIFFCRKELQMFLYFKWNTFFTHIPFHALSRVASVKQQNNLLNKEKFSLPITNSQTTIEKNHFRWYIFSVGLLTFLSSWCVLPQSVIDFSVSQKGWISKICEQLCALTLVCLFLHGTSRSNVTPVINYNLSMEIDPFLELYFRFSKLHYTNLLTHSTYINWICIVILESKVLTICIHTYIHA